MTEEAVKKLNADPVYALLTIHEMVVETLSSALMACRVSTATEEFDALVEPVFDWITHEMIRIEDHIKAIEEAAQ
jgi:hypothetical protein